MTVDRYRLVADGSLRNLDHRLGAGRGQHRRRTGGDACRQHSPPRHRGGSKIAEFVHNKNIEINSETREINEKIKTILTKYKCNF